MFFKWCFIIKIVVFVFCWMVLIKVIVFCFVCGLRLVKGLLKSKIFDWLIRMFVIDICCFWLFDKFCGWCCNNWFSLIILDYLWIVFFIFVCLIVLFFKVKVIFLVIVKLINCLLVFCKIVFILKDKLNRFVFWIFLLVIVVVFWILFL